MSAARATHYRLPRTTFGRWVQSHRRTLFVFFLVMSVGGILIGRQLPVALFPQVPFPRVVVSVEAGDRPAEEMAALVTYPTEEALRRVPEVTHLRSATSRGSCEVSVEFKWGSDMARATLQVETAIAQLMPDLPAGTRTLVRRMDPTVFPVIAYSMTSATRSATELYDLVYYQIRPRLTVIGGVATVAVLGGAREEVHVVVSPERLAEFDMTMADLGAALEATNVVRAGGILEDEYKLYLVLTDNRYADLTEIGDTVIRTGGGGLVRLDDLATIEKSAEPQRTIVNADGRPGVIFQVYQQRDGNTVQIAAAVRQALSRMESTLPSDIRVETWYDQSDLILESAKSVRDAVMIGISLAMIVLFGFLRNVRITLIVAIVVPATLAGTTVLLKIMGQGLNLMTLGGMAAAVGLIIDDVIVIVEHIVRKMEESARGPGGHEVSVLDSAREFLRPLAGSSSATIIVFAPLAFLSGVTGAFFRALSLTMAMSLLLSFFVALAVVPLMAEYLLRGHLPQTEGGPRFAGFYRRLMNPVLHQPALVLLPIAVIVGMGWFGMKHTGSGFLPATDEGGFILDYRAAPGTSLTETNRLLVQVEEILQSTPEVRTYSRRTGLQLGGGLTESNQGDYFIRLVPPPRRGVEQIMEDVRIQVAEKIPGLEVEMAQLMEDLIGDLTAVPQPIEVKLFGDSGSELERIAPRVAQALNEIAGVVDLKSGVVLAGDAITVKVDHAASALEGVDPALVANAVSRFVEGAVVTNLPKGEKMVGVRVWTPLSVRDRVADIGRIRIRSSKGYLVPLSRIARIQRVVGQSQIERDDLRRMVAVTGRISGRDMGSVMRDVTNRLEQPGLLPAHVYYRLGGLYSQQQKAFRGLMMVFGAAVTLVFLALLFLYERLRVAVAMLITAGLAVLCVMFGLWLTGTERNIASMMGLTMIVGIVTEVAIFVYSEYIEQVHYAGPDDDPLVEAGVHRIRPIAMTTFAAILALLPLALGIGQGSGMLQPLAIAIVVGLFAQLPLSLAVLPALLRLFRVAPRGTSPE